MGVSIEALDVEAFDAALPALAEVLQACVAGGASVNFVCPFSLEEARAFFLDKVRPAVVAGHRVVLAAWVDGEIVGTVQLACDTPPNQPHRADVTKLLVHPKARRRGIGRHLMEALHEAARARGRSLLTLDTLVGDAAEPLYVSVGYRRVGPIPGYSLAPDGSGRLDATMIMYCPLGERVPLE
ncbi:GNAT family N-acetyltransferase [Acuticoccus mangrovi]|uniref:GNAT family N-acetyltransferase n=1 Tax=Acuticoccus mangrovi TaxID=2796142 RepID=A0A934IP74_9HYPH|nr:GNAT family N-acetyltransferase [Acuticoccus mangrovi]MBJ3776195.1 GNAT family N-acetyltransferase [Acuticoccus mangrovi]